MENLSLIQIILVVAVPAVFAITVHEAAHGYTARHFGDRTAELLGRLTLNPIKHIDPVGTVIVPLVLLTIAKTTGGPLVMFGWAKPVPVGVRNLKNPHRDMAIVAAAGPASNIAMAAGWTVILIIAGLLQGVLPIAEALAYMASFGVFFNVILAVFNMLPIPPLDGGRVLRGFLSPQVSSTLDRVEPYGLMIVILLLMTGVLWNVIGPVVAAVSGFFFGLAGL